MGEIYSATNNITGMIYIGKTTDSMTKRKSDHETKALRKTNNIRFHNAIRKYGPKNFEWKVILVCDDEELNYWEVYYIKKFKANNKKFGYNMTDGGENDPKCNLGRKFSKEHCQKISKALSLRKISDCTRKKMSISQKERFLNDNNLRNVLLSSKNAKEVDQYSTQGEYIKTWGSIEEASISVGVDSSNISRSCSGEFKTSAGFIWRYRGDPLTEEDLIDINTPRILTDTHKDKISKGLRKKVNQYSLDGSFIMSWEGIDTASEQTGVARSGIIRCCRGIYKKAGGFIWKYE